MLYNKNLDIFLQSNGVLMAFIGQLPYNIVKHIIHMVYFNLYSFK